MPPSALAQISELRDYKYNGELVYTMRILNIKSHIHSHCIPGDYFAEEGVCYLPQHVILQIISINNLVYYYNQQFLDKSLFFMRL